MKNISWQWKISLTVKNITDSEKYHRWKFLLSIDIFYCQWKFSLSIDIFYCQWKFSLSVVILTVKMWYFLLSNIYWTKNAFNLVTYEDSSESWLQMKFFLVKKIFFTHVKCQNVPERVVLVCVSSPGLQTFQESFWIITIFILNVVIIIFILINFVINR